MRKPLPNSKTLFKIFSVLQRYPDGIWYRRLAKESKVPLSTVHFYLEKYLDRFIENVGFKNPEGHYVGIRVVKLKKGTTLKQIMDYHRVKAAIKQQPQ